MNGDVVHGLVVLLMLFATYLFPTLVALGRGKKNATAIGILNLFLGWTFIGWVVALIWAFTFEAKNEQPPASLGS